MDRVVLWIELVRSKCGNCNMGCNPFEETHETVLGYGGQRKGCGARYTHVGAPYQGTEEDVKEMRPDLIPVWEENSGIINP